MRSGEYSNSKLVFLSKSYFNPKKGEAGPWNQFILPSVPPFPIPSPPLSLNELSIEANGLVILSRPARRPNPMPADALIGPIFFVATTYSELYHPVPMKSLSPRLRAGIKLVSLINLKSISKLRSWFVLPEASLPFLPWPEYLKLRPILGEIWKVKPVRANPGWKLL